MAVIARKPCPLRDRNDVRRSVFTVNRDELSETHGLSSGAYARTPIFHPQRRSASHMRHAGRRLLAGRDLHYIVGIFGDAFDVDGNNFGGWAGCDRWSAGRAPGMG